MIGARAFLAMTLLCPCLLGATKSSVASDIDVLVVFPDDSDVTGSGLRPVKEAAGNPAPIASPSDRAGSAAEQSDGAMRPLYSAPTDRDSSLASVPQSLPPVVFDFPDANPRMVEPATVEAFIALHPQGRFRIVTVNADEIREVVCDKLRGVERVVEIALFPDTVIAATTTTVKVSYSTGVSVWSGKEVGSTSTTMTLAVGPDGATMGEFITSGGMFRIDVTAQPPFHVIWQWPPDAEFGPID